MILEYNLQFFAKEGPGGEKTEEPTTKRLEDARKDGKVAKSKELSHGVTLLAFFLMLKFYAGNMGIRFLELFSFAYNRMDEYTTMKDGMLSSGDFAGMVRTILGRILLIMLPILLVAFALCFIVDVAQVKWKPTTKPLQPKFSKMNPLKGMKRLFSKQSLVELVKSIVKIVLVVYIAYSTVKDFADELFFMYSYTVPQAIGWMGERILNLGIKISIFYVILAFLDVFYERRKFHEDMKMTKQEVKDEYKNAEGDPQIKGKIRRKMQEASMRRMMQDIPKADVVITNPTHLSVAIKYDPAVGDAPVVLAKGEDYLALKIREVAREHNIQIVENKPLARMLYHNVDIGAAIPPELYQAVAEVLAMVYHAQGKV